MSVNYLLCLFELKFLRVVRVHCGGDRAAQRVARPDADDLACNAGLFTTADEGVAQLVRVVVGQQPLHARGNRVEVGAFRFLKVDTRQYLFYHWCKRDLPKDDVLSQALLARLALQPLIVDDLNAFELGFSQAEIEKNKQSVRTLDTPVRLAVVDKARLLVLCERTACSGLVGGQHDLLHGGGNVIILCRHVEDAVEHERQLFRLAVFIFAHDAEEIGLKIVPCDLCKRLAAEHGLQIYAEGAFVLLEGRGFRRLFLDLQPFAGVVCKEDGLGAALLFGGLFGRGGCRIAGGEPVHKAAAHGLEVSSRGLHIQPLAADARLKVAVRGDAIVYDVVVCDKNLSDMFGHGFDLLFGEFETVFALFRKFPVFPVQGDGVHRLTDGAHLPVERRERVFRCGKCGVGYSLFSQCSMLLRELLCSLAHRIQCSLSLRSVPPV